MGPTGILAVLAGLAALAGPASSAPAMDRPAGLRTCAAIVDDQARLACYDRIAGHRPDAPSGGQGAVSAADVVAGTLKDAPPRPMTVPVKPARPAGASASPNAASLLTDAWAFNPDSERYLIKLYRPNFVAPVRWQSRVNRQPLNPFFDAFDVASQDLDPIEAAFQISFKTRLWASENRRLGAWFAYTQLSYWQFYNGDLSSPFRDTNYMPELKLSWQPGLSFGGLDWNLLNLGYTHESNGRSDPISRSWDRLVAEFGIERGNLALLIRPWLRIDEQADDRDNPDITDYYGHGDITAVYKWRGHSVALMARGNLAEWKGAARLSWVTPPFLGPLRGYAEAFIGYGDTLLDYNFNQSAIAVGLALNDILDP
jgi:phospholipase A1